MLCIARFLCAHGRRAGCGWGGGRMRSPLCSSNKSNFIVALSGSTHNAYRKSEMAGWMGEKTMRKKKRKTNKFFKRFYVVSDNIKTNSEEGKKAKSSTEKLISSIRVLFSYPRLMLRESKSRIYLFTFRRPFRRAGKPARIRVPNSTSGIRKGNRLMDTHKRPSSARSLSISNFHFYLSLYQFQLFFFK